MVIPPIYNGDTATLQWWYHQFTMVIPTIYNGDTNNLQWWCHQFTMVIPPLYNGDTNNLQWWYHQFTVVIPPFLKGIVKALLYKISILPGTIWDSFSSTFSYLTCFNRISFSFNIWEVRSHLRIETTNLLLQPWFLKCSNPVPIKWSILVILWYI